MKRTALFAVIVIAALALGLNVMAAGKLAKDQVLRINLGIAEPDSLDPAKSTGVAEASIEMGLCDGLTRLGAAGEVLPAVAKSWEISKDGKTYIFHLRDSKWNNGDPVTAQDFEWAWKRVLAPATASDYAYQLWYLKNGQEYTEGKVKAEEVGVKALDAQTLKVELIAPTGYFLKLCAFQTYLPVHRKSVEPKEDSWFMNPKSYVSNGPFRLASWEHNARITLKKNPLYWDTAHVRLDTVEITLVDSQATELTMLETDQLDFGYSIPPAELPRLQKEGKLKIAPYLGCYYYMINVKRGPLGDKRVRKALALAIDRTAIAALARGGQKPATGYVPPGIPDAAKGSDFRKTGGTFLPETPDLANAKKLLSDAGFPGGKGFPAISILYNTLETHKTIAEAIQEMWRKNLGINVTLTNQEWNVYMDNRRNFNYDVCRAGWIADYIDPMTFIDMWLTDSGNNQTQWSNKKYDELVDTAKNSADPKVRIASMHEAERILMDEMPILPIYFYTRPYILKPWVQGMFILPTGQVDFKLAVIQAH